MPPSSRSASPWRVVLTTAGLLAGVAASVAGTLFYRALRPRAPRADHSKTVVAAVGDSNTFGAGALLAYPFQSYPAQLQRLLGDDHQVINFGFSGRTLLAGADQPYTAEGMYAQSLAAAPDVVLIMLGTNDAKTQNWDAEAYASELAAFVRGYQDLPSEPRVYLLTPPAAFANAFTIDPRTVADEVVPIVVATAEATGAGLIDVFAATAGRRDLIPDGIHPDAEGLGIVARTVYDAIG